MEQIITEDGRLVENLDAHIQRIGIKDAGLDYHMIAIIGPQSSGKSTIMNLLFGTSFQTMNEQIGRQQTTKGIHAATNNCPDNPILAFDVEGCDSRERGDSEALFERKAGLFAMALSEVLMINMWESDIGRYNASNIPMLRMVFEVNVQLFLTQQDIKTTLLFVIRDFTTDAFEAICDNLRRDMNGIWSEISLPDKLKGRSIEDFFEFKFFTIRHMKIQREKFDEDVEVLKQMFHDKSHPRYLFAEKSTKLVPGDGLTQYVTSVWDTIVDNKELNLPSQRLMLALFKCDENIQTALSVLKSDLEDNIVNPIAKDEFVMNFCQPCKNALDKAVELYRSASWRYDAEAVEKKEHEMKVAISDFMFPMFVKNCDEFAKKLLHAYGGFLNALGDELEKGGSWFADTMERQEAILGQFSAFIESSTVEPFNWEYATVSLESQMTEVLTVRKDKLVENLHTRVKTSILYSLGREMNEILKQAKPEMWEQLRAIMAMKLNDGRQQMEAIFATNLREEERTADMTRLVAAVNESALQLVKEAADFIDIKMKAAFDRVFKHDNQGRPRVWTASEDIGDIFDTARQKGLDVLRLFHFCLLIKDCDEKSISQLRGVLIEEKKYNEAAIGYEKSIRYEYEAAEIAMKAHATRNQIPPFVWFLFVVFCGDRCTKILANPIVFILVVIVGGGVFLLRQIGLWDVIIERVRAGINQAMDGIETADSGEKDESPGEAEEDEEEEATDDDGNRDLSGLLSTVTPSRPPRVAFSPFSNLRAAEQPVKRLSVPINRIPKDTH